MWSGGHQWACSSRLSTGDLESISWFSLEKIVGVVFWSLVCAVLRSVGGFGGHQWVWSGGHKWVGLEGISGCGLEGISGCGLEGISGCGPESVSGCGPEDISRDYLQMCPQQKPSRGVSGGIG